MKKEIKKIVKQKTKKQPKVKLVSFTITAIIPTEPYGNIQPAITVQAANIEDAKSVVMPHIDALMAQYSMNAPKKVNMPTTTMPGTPSIKSTEVVAPKEPVAPKADEKPLEGTVSVPYQKALNAIKTAYSIPALDLIDDQIIFSKKLHYGEKIRLKPFVEEKRKEIKAK